MLRDVGKEEVTWGNTRHALIMSLLMTVPSFVINRRFLKEMCKEHRK